MRLTRLSVWMSRDKWDTVSVLFGQIVVGFFSVDARGNETKLEETILKSIIPIQDIKISTSIIISNDVQHT
jgi:hypothetical protein